MTVALLIYAINLFSNLRCVAHEAFIFSFIGFVFLIAAYAISFVESDTGVFRRSVKSGLIIDVWILCISLTIQTFLPSERTSYMMVGGYIAENIATSEQFTKSLNEAGNLTGKLTTIVNNKLDGYIKETEQELTKSFDNEKK